MIADTALRTAELASKLGLHPQTILTVRTGLKLTRCTG
jgi:hypothetical protein